MNKKVTLGMPFNVCLWRQDEFERTTRAQTTSGKLTLVSKSGIFSPTWDLTECRIVFQGKTKV